MTALNKQACQVRRYTNYGVDMMEWDDGKYVKYSDYLALLDELEASQKSNEFLKEQLAQLANFNPDWDKLEAATDSLREHMAKLSAAENRIAELEARTVKLPTGTEINGFQMLIESEVIALLREAGINVTVVRAAGIGVKGE